MQQMESSFCMNIKGKVHPKKENFVIITHPHVISKTFSLPWTKAKFVIDIMVFFL